MKEAWRSLRFPLEEYPGKLLGMTCKAEQDYCEALARDTYEGWGELVELGCFLGSLSIPLARGLRANPRPSVRERSLRAFDLFFWHRSMEGSIRGSVLEGRMTEGDWFEELYAANTASVADRIAFRLTDLGAESWDGGPIEILVVDAMKYDVLTNNIVREFFPALRPGSLLLHQDYLHFYEGWIHLMTYEQRTVLEKVTEVERNSTVVFRVTGDLAPFAAAYPPERIFAETPPELLREVYAWQRHAISPDYHDAIEAAAIMSWVHTGQLEEANRAYREQAPRFGDSAQFKWMRNFLTAKGHHLGWE
jgi:hypothetical protein